MAIRIMRILSIAPRFNPNSGGDGLYAYHLALGLVSCDAQISILTIRDNKFVLLTPCKDNDKEEKKEILGAIGLNLLTQNYYSRDARKAVEKAVKISCPDVIHIHGLHQYFTLSTALYLKMLGVRTVLTMHDYKALCGNAGFFSDRSEDICLKCLEGKFLPPINERCKKNSYIQSIATAAQMAMWEIWKGLDAVDCFHCGSEFVFQLLGNNPLTRDRRAKVRFPYLRPAPPEKFTKSESIRIIYSGRMVPHKGPKIFVSATRDIKNVPVHIFGDGPLLNEMEKLTKGMDNVTFHGWKTHEEMQDQLGPGSVVVVPYLAHETFCYVVLEAMMAGSCVVASARGAIPEFIKDGVNGLLIHNPSAEAFRTSIQSLLDNPNRIRSLGANATEIANDVPTLADHTAAILNLYSSISKKKKS
jgi:glycosyltransferase involved in cell wall biosynthesis